MNLNEITRKDLDSLISRLLDAEHGEIPCMSATLRRLMALEPDSDASMQELAEIILEDYGLIKEVLQVVNSSFYRRLNTEITTVTQAVIFLGFNTVRSIAVDMAVLDLLPSHTQGVAVKVMAQAFLSAGLAQEVAEHCGRKNPESIFVASLFRPMARIVTVLQEPEIYSRLCEMENANDSAQRQLVRNFLRETGYRLAELWSIPAGLTGFMEGCRQFASSVDADELSLARHSNRMSRMIIDGHGQEEIHDLVESFEKEFNIEKEVLIQCIQAATARTSDKSEALKELFRHIRVSQILNPPEEEYARSSLPTKSETPEQEQRHDDRDELFLDLLNQITQAILESKFTIDQVLLLAVEVIRRGLAPSNIALCLFTPDRKKLVVRYALGEQAGIIKKRLSVKNPLNSPPLKAAFQNDMEVMGTWKQLMEQQESDQQESLYANQLCASPIQVKGRAIGCFLVDFNSSRVLGAKDLKKIAQVRGLVAISAMQRAGGS